ncbi:MAG TPA: hypothetical protein VK814_07620 [Acidobacteriaceae bacterium]|jgi:hypothetical protein|nr:hypothetical protein [Acidobacteriaceae bacterium]
MALNLPSATLAVGALGTAATGLVDTTKVFGAFGTSRVGFGFIKKTISRLLPSDAEAENCGLDRIDIFNTLLANWINGMDSAAQKAAATSFVKLHLDESSAPGLAKATGVDPTFLLSVAKKLKQAGTPESALSIEETDTFGRFDLSVAALVDKAYQQGDQRYRNVCKALACLLAVGLALVANGQINPPLPQWQVILIGLVATPLAPVAKDIANAIQSASDTLGKFRG